MGMVVKTNMMALNSNRALNKNNSTVSKNVEKLSTGMRINRAADDASGLAISEKMKAQIKALDTASANAEDGISLIQTAEGYMSEVHDMLNRIVELAEKSANGTYETVASGAGFEKFSTSSNKNQTATDRQALQDEVNNLCAEIDRIAETANFNNLKLMNGTLDANNKNTKSANPTNNAATDNDTLTSGSISVSGYSLTLQIGETSGASDKLSVNIKSFKTNQLFADLAISDNLVSTGGGKDNSLLAVNDAKANGGVSQNASGVTVNISNQAVASLAAEKVRDIIDNVSAQRATLGAQQNRLEYTVNNLNTASENITSANSRIRDTDMAKEMMKYTQANVLTQAAQSMLAQANQAPQQILQLLQ